MGICKYKHMKKYFLFFGHELRLLMQIPKTCIKYHWWCSRMVSETCSFWDDGEAANSGQCHKSGPRHGRELNRWQYRFRFYPWPTWAWNYRQCRAFWSIQSWWWSYTSVGLLNLLRKRRTMINVFLYELCFIIIIIFCFKNSWFLLLI